MQRSPSRSAVLISNLLLLVACGGDSAESSGGRTVRGRATIPARTGTGPVLIVVGGVAPGDFYGVGASADDGTFEVPVDIPDEATHALVVAVAPEDPNRAALALVELDGDSAGKADDAGGGPIQVTLDALSTASAYVWNGAGVLWRGASRPELDGEVSLLEAQIEQGQVPMCAPELDDHLVTQAQQIADAHRTGTQERYDAYGRGEGALLDRLRLAVDDISEDVVSGNRWSGRNIARGFSIYTQYRVAMTRYAMQGVTDLELHGLHEDRSTIGRDELDRIADVILDNGYGNCREKGLLAAFAATRFPELKQIKVISIDAEAWWGTHQFAIACTNDRSELNLEAYHPTDPEQGEIAPEWLLNGDCYVLDPWTNTTAPLTRELIEEQGWETAVQWLDVDPAQPAPPPNQRAVGESCEVDAPAPDEAAVCTPFEIPPELLPGDPTPTPGPSGVSFVGSCHDSGGEQCTNFWSLPVAAASFEQACTFASGSWSEAGCTTSGALGSCTLFAGTERQFMLVFYADPEAEETLEEQTAERRADCEGLPADSGGPGVWTSPYRGP